METCAVINRKLSNKLKIKKTYLEICGNLCGNLWTLMR